jgi:hypothetical protein
MKYTKLQIADAIHTYVDMRKTYIVWKRQVERDKELRNAPEFLEFKVQLKEKELGLQQMAVDLGMDLWDSTQGCAALGFLDGFLAGLGSLPTYRTLRATQDQEETRILEGDAVDYYEPSYEDAKGLHWEAGKGYTNDLGCK